MIVKFIVFFIFIYNEVCSESGSRFGLAFA